jgi:hypothetical protein
MVLGLEDIGNNVDMILVLITKCSGSLGPCIKDTQKSAEFSTLLSCFLPFVSVCTAKFPTPSSCVKIRSYGFLLANEESPPTTTTTVM